MIEPVAHRAPCTLFRPALRTRFRALVAAVCSLLILISLSCSRDPGKKAGDTAPKPIAVTELVVRPKEVRRNIESVGSLFPMEEVTVSSEVEGRVEQVLVDVGDRVSAGRPIVKIVPTELQYTADEQKAALQQARARLGISNDSDDLKDVRAAAEVKRAAADLADAEQKYKRSKTLYEQALIPKQDYDEAESRYNALRAAYELAVQTVENLRAQLAQSHAQAKLAQKKLSDATIRAPFAGEIKERAVTQGQYLKVQTPVMVIVDVDTLRVRLKVPEKMAAWTKVGQPVTISVEAFPGKTFSGKISRINPAVDQQTRTFEVEALIENHDHELKPGFFVKAVIPSDKVDTALFLPEEALLYVYGVYKIFVIEGSNLKEKEVKLGAREGDEVEVVEGLAAGERVALPPKGQELRDGAPIEIVQQNP